MTIGDRPPVRIPLTQGKYALIDAEDCRRISIHKWSFDGRYAKRSRNKDDPSGTSVIFMHRVVMSVENCGREIQVDHIYGDRLDNRFSNLRLSSVSENHANSRLSSANTSGFKGVSFDANWKKWRATIGLRNKEVRLGGFDTAEEAAHAYDEKLIELFGDFALTNEGLGNYDKV